MMDASDEEIRRPPRLLKELVGAGEWQPLYRGQKLQLDPFLTCACKMIMAVPLPTIFDGVLNCARVPIAVLPKLLLSDALDPFLYFQWLIGDNRKNLRENNVIGRLAAAGLGALTVTVVQFDKFLILHHENVLWILPRATSGLPRFTLMNKANRFTIRATERALPKKRYWQPYECVFSFEPNHQRGSYSHYRLKSWHLPTTRSREPSARRKPKRIGRQTRAERRREIRYAKGLASGECVRKGHAPLIYTDPRVWNEEEMDACKTGWGTEWSQVFCKTPFRVLAPVRSFHHVNVLQLDEPCMLGFGDDEVLWDTTVDDDDDDEEEEAPPKRIGRFDELMFYLSDYHDLAVKVLAYLVMPQPMQIEWKYVQSFDCHICCPKESTPSGPLGPTDTNITASTEFLDEKHFVRMRVPQLLPTNLPPLPAGKELDDDDDGDEKLLFTEEKLIQNDWDETWAPERWIHDSERHSEYGWRSIFLAIDIDDQNDAQHHSINLEQFLQSSASRLDSFVVRCVGPRHRRRETKKRPKVIGRWLLRRKVDSSPLLAVGDIYGKTELVRFDDGACALNLTWLNGQHVQYSFVLANCFFYRSISCEWKPSEFLSHRLSCDRTIPLPGRDWNRKSWEKPDCEVFEYATDRHHTIASFIIPDRYYRSRGTGHSKRSSSASYTPLTNVASGSGTLTVKENGITSYKSSDGRVLLDHSTKDGDNKSGPTLLWKAAQYRVPTRISPDRWLNHLSDWLSFKDLSLIRLIIEFVGLRPIVSFGHPDRDLAQPTAETLQWCIVKMRVVPQQTELVIPIESPEYIRNRRKIRASIVHTIELQYPMLEMEIPLDEDITEAVNAVTGTANTVYRIGSVTLPDKFDRNKRVGCTSGIHCHLAREEVFNWIPRESCLVPKNLPLKPTSDLSIKVKKMMDLREAGEQKWVAAEIVEEDQRDADRVHRLRLKPISTADAKYPDEWIDLYDTKTTENRLAAHKTYSVAGSCKRGAPGGIIRALFSDGKWRDCRLDIWCHESDQFRVIAIDEPKKARWLSSLSCNDWTIANQEIKSPKEEIKVAKEKVEEVVYRPLPLSAEIVMPEASAPLLSEIDRGHEDLILQFDQITIPTRSISPSEKATLLSPEKATLLSPEKVALKKKVQMLA